MSEKQPDFIPLSAQLGIAGSSYMLQMGKVSNFWAIRLVKGPDVLDSKVFKDTGQEMPNANVLTGWVLSVLTIPNINTYQIQKTIGFIRQQSLRTLDEQQAKKKEQGKAESASVSLETVADRDIKRPKPVGWVKDEQPVQEQKTISAEMSPALTASNQQATGKNSPSPNPTEAVPTKESSPTPTNLASVSPSSSPIPSNPSPSSRVLPPIPRGDDFVPTESVKNVPVEPQKVVISNKSPSMESRLDALEARVLQLEKENKSLISEIEKLKSH
jgi:hypothetical protein